MLTQQRILNVYDGLRSNKGFLEKELNLYIQIAGNPAFQLVQKEIIDEHIKRIKEILALVETGLVYFEKKWINPNGTVKKFSFWNPFSWKLMSESISYYAGLFSQIADVYTLDPQANYNFN